MLQYNQEMSVRDTKLRVRIEKGLSGLDKLVVTDTNGNLLHEITPFGRGKRIDDVDPVEYNHGRITVGYGANHVGIVRLYESKERILPIGNRSRQMVHYNLITGEEVPDFSL